ncbi:Transmembrane domain-containing protein [Spironucleus salmonicida]|uniref:Transmembrane domain-containing protein n=1 Tax=Spironucleus salmonicida TaxID=348837 RepID=V6LTV0_9EUKA|nr:Transmembrane domain-containing protein [Spironucleus salmonicida]|eukprot:EST44189.1 Transmembrane domain-containing protein [Spironucleus salmonicida]
MTDAPLIQELPLGSDMVAERGYGASPATAPVQLVDGNKLLTVRDIFCRCAAPRYERCQKLVGCSTAIVPGAGLLCCVCCYGADRLDRCDVVLAGIVLQLSSYLVVGWVVACIVGFKMFMLK